MQSCCFAKPIAFCRSRYFRLHPWNLFVWSCSIGSKERAQGARPPLVLFLDQTEARGAKKTFFGDWAPPYLRVWMPAPPPYSPPLFQGLYPALSCTYILLMVAILLIIGQLINRFSFSVFSLWHYLTVTVQGKHFILSLKVRGLRNRLKRNSIFSFL